MRESKLERLAHRPRARGDLQHLLKNTRPRGSESACKNIPSNTDQGVPVSPPNLTSLGRNYNNGERRKMFSTGRDPAQRTESRMFALKA